MHSLNRLKVFKIAVWYLAMAIFHNYRRVQLRIKTYRFPIYFEPNPQ